MPKYTRVGRPSQNQGAEGIARLGANAISPHQATPSAPAQAPAGAPAPQAPAQSTIIGSPEYNERRENATRIGEINARIDELLGNKSPGLTGDPLTSVFQSSTTESRERDELLGELESLGGSRPGMPAPLGSTIPEAPDLPEEERVAAVDAQKQFEEDQFAAALEDQGRADERATDFQADTDELVRLIDEAIVDQDEDRVRFLTELKDAKEAIQGMPEEVTSEFNRLRDEFGVEADASFDRLDTQLADALAGAEEGRSEAMQAAVQGLQGTVNSEVAKIMANPNLTQSQKQSMVSQVRLTGASAIAPVIGQTVLAFNKLSADIAMSFGTTFGALEGTVINAKGQLIGAQGQAFTQVQIAIGTITAQLLDVDASASASYTTAQSQLLATRSHATLTGNQLLLDLLPEQGTPYLDITGSTMLDYVTKDNSVRGQFAMDLQSTGMDITVAMLQADQGNPWWDVAMGFIQGGPAGGAVAIADTIFNPQGPDI